MINYLLVAVVMIKAVNSQNVECVDGSIMQTDEKYADSYCGSLINWPISQQTLDNFTVYDKLAFDQYTKLYQKWKTEGQGAGQINPANDCLGIARDVFCAYNYKYCDSDSKTEYYGICQFLCDIWQDRCPKETETYDLISKTSKEENCSFTFRLLAEILFSITILFIIFV